MRHLEGFFDSMEKKRGEGDSLGAIMPDETQVSNRFVKKIGEPAELSQSTSYCGRGE